MKSFVGTFVLIGIFITGILSFIVIFPSGMGITSFQDNQSNDAYLTIQNNSDIGVTNTGLSSLENSTSSGFNDWDVTTGFMGSGTMKQASGSGVKTNFLTIMNLLWTMIVLLFTSNSPIAKVILTLTTFGTLYIIYLVYKFVRTGN